jgi:Flp pilus assembly protein TadG
VMTPAHRRLTRLRAARGQSIVEFAIMLPLLLLVCLGVVETSYALIDQHVVTKLAREGSNLISRDTSLQQAGAVLSSMSTTPLNFNDGTSTVIFSVLMKGGTTGTSNYGQVVLFQRAKFGSFVATSRLNTGSGSYGGPPDFLATNPDTNTGLQVTNISDSIINVNGGFLYVTEIFTRHNLITPLDRLMPYGVTIPNTLYSIAYF